MRRHRGARNLHSSPLLVHCCVMLRPNWNVGDYFMFHETKGLKTIKKIIFSSLLVVFARPFTTRGWTLGGWRQVKNKCAVSFDGPSAWSIVGWRSCTCSWAPAIIKNLLKLFCFAKLFMDGALGRKIWKFNLVDAIRPLSSLDQCRCRGKLNDITSIITGFRLKYRVRWFFLLAKPKKRVKSPTKLLRRPRLCCSGDELHESPTPTPIIPFIPFSRPRPWSLCIGDGRYCFASVTLLEAKALCGNFFVARGRARRGKWAQAGASK